MSQDEGSLCNLKMKFEGEKKVEIKLILFFFSELINLKYIKH